MAEHPIFSRRYRALERRVSRNLNNFSSTAVACARWSGGRRGIASMHGLPCQPCIPGGGVPGSGSLHRPHNSVETVGLPSVYPFDFALVPRDIALTIA